MKKVKGHTLIKFNRALSVLLVAAMVAGMAPETALTAYAAEAETETEEPSLETASTEPASTEAASGEETAAEETSETAESSSVTEASEAAETPSVTETPETEETSETETETVAQTESSTEMTTVEDTDSETSETETAVEETTENTAGEEETETLTTEEEEAGESVEALASNHKAVFTIDNPEAVIVKAVSDSESVSDNNYDWDSQTELDSATAAAGVADTTRYVYLYVEAKSGYEVKSVTDGKESSETKVTKADDLSSSNFDVYKVDMENATDDITVNITTAKLLTYTITGQADAAEVEYTPDGGSKQTLSDGALLSGLKGVTLTVTDKTTDAQKVKSVEVAYGETKAEMTEKSDTPGAFTCTVPAGTTDDVTITVNAVDVAKVSLTNDSTTTDVTVGGKPLLTGLEIELTENFVFTVSKKADQSPYDELNSVEVTTNTGIAGAEDVPVTDLGNPAEDCLGDYTVKTEDLAGVKEVKITVSKFEKREVTVTDNTDTKVEFSNGSVVEDTEAGKNYTVKRKDVTFTVAYLDNGVTTNNSFYSSEQTTVSVSVTVVDASKNKIKLDKKKSVIDLNKAAGTWNDTVKAAEWTAYAEKGKAYTFSDSSVAITGAALDTESATDIVKSAVAVSADGNNIKFVVTNKEGLTSTIVPVKVTFAAGDAEVVSFKLTMAAVKSFDAVAAEVLAAVKAVPATGVQQTDLANVTAAINKVLNDNLTAGVSAGSISVASDAAAKTAKATWTLRSKADAEKTKTETDVDLAAAAADTPVGTKLTAQDCMDILYTQVSTNLVADKVADADKDTKLQITVDTKLIDIQRFLQKAIKNSDYQVAVYEFVITTPPTTTTQGVAYVMYALVKRGVVAEGEYDDIPVAVLPAAEPTPAP